MLFKVKARVLLELGAELISSDQIALYELIKNSIDAKSPKVEVTVNVGLTFSGYRTMRDKIAALGQRALTGSYIRAELLRFFPPATTDEVREQFVLALENSRSSNALTRLREFYRAVSYIKVDDGGHGMTLEQVDQRFLTVGTPHRKLQKAGQLPLEEGAEEALGEKGIGRLSCMRLGHHLTMRTTRRNMPKIAKIEIDWAELLDKWDLDLSGFLVESEELENKSRIADRGTSLIISDLRSDWSREDLYALIRDQFSKLQDPFDKDIPRVDLRFYFNNDKIDFDWRVSEKYFNDEWHGYFKVKFGYIQKDGREEARLTGVVKYRVPATDGIESFVDENEIDVSEETMLRLTADTKNRPASTDDAAFPEQSAGLATLGPFTAEGYWFNRLRFRNEISSEEKYRAFKLWMDRWGGGLLIYRNGFRVYPYAEPENDWLELDQRAFSARSYKFNRGQFVGRVLIGAKTNPYLVDQTNRQGLVDTPEKDRLIALLQHTIWQELGALARKYERERAKTPKSSMDELDRGIRQRSKLAHQQVTQLVRAVPQQAERVRELASYIDTLEEAWARAKATIKGKEKDTEKYLHLAGVGMLLEFIVHELNRVSKTALEDIKRVGKQGLPPGLESIYQQLKTLEKRLRILDPVSTPGRQRKTDVDVGTILETLIEAHGAQFERHRIDGEMVPARPVLIASAVEGHLYQIFENLFSNSVYWLDNRRAYLSQTDPASARAFKPKISIRVDRSERLVTFEDNGIGISRADSRKVFEAFFTNKPQEDGRGLGLFLVKKLCEDNDIEVSLLPPNSEGTHSGFQFLFPAKKVKA